MGESLNQYNSFIICVNLRFNFSFQVDGLAPAAFPGLAPRRLPCPDE
jgi:hypothetical protein